MEWRTAICLALLLSRLQPPLWVLAFFQRLRSQVSVLYVHCVCCQLARLLCPAVLDALMPSELLGSLPTLQGVSLNSCLAPLPSRLRPPLWVLASLKQLLSGERPCMTLQMGKGMGVALMRMMLSKDQGYQLSASRAWYARG